MWRIRQPFLWFHRLQTDFWTSFLAATLSRFTYIYLRTRTRVPVRNGSPPHLHLISRASPTYKLCNNAATGLSLCWSKFVEVTFSFVQLQVSRVTEKDGYPDTNGEDAVPLLSSDLWGGLSRALRFAGEVRRPGIASDRQCNDHVDGRRTLFWCIFQSCVSLPE